MKEQIKAMKAQLAALVTKGKSIAGELEGKTGKDADELNVLLAQTIEASKKLRDEIHGLEFLEVTDAYLNAPEAEPKSKQVQSERSPESYLKSRNLKAFKHGTMREREERAFRFAQFAAAAIVGNEKAFQWCQEHGIKFMLEVEDRIREVKTMKETINTTGGFLIPTEFDQDFIDLRERFGVFRANARIVPMRGDKKLRSRRTAGLTAYFAGEAGAITESEKGWDQVELSAKKLMTLTRISSELAEDVMIDLGDDLMEEAGYAFAAKEDDCGFNGDATSTFGGIVGLRQRLVDVYTASGGVGLIQGSGNSYSALIRGDFNKVVASLPEFAERPDTAWYCSKFFWASVMVPIVQAAGGATASEIEGMRRKEFMGYPVNISQKLPKVTASAQVCCLFGSLKLSSDFGDRRRTSFSMTEHRYFDTDEIGVKATERFDIQNHSVGDTDDAGPVVGLITA